MPKRQRQRLIDEDTRSFRENLSPEHVKNTLKWNAQLVAFFKKHPDGATRREIESKRWTPEDNKGLCVPRMNYILVECGNGSPKRYTLQLPSTPGPWWIGGKH